MSQLHLELVLQFHFDLVGWYLQHWCGHLLFVFAEFVNLIIQKLYVSTQFAPVFGRS